MKTMFRGSHQQPDVAKREGKECKMRRWEVEKLRLQEPHGAKTYMKLIRKIHEVARCKDPLSWN